MAFVYGGLMGVGSRRLVVEGDESSRRRWKARRGGRSSLACMRMMDEGRIEDDDDEEGLTLLEDVDDNEVDRMDMKKKAELLEREPFGGTEVGAPSSHVERVSVEVGGKEMIFETGMVARQASGSVILRCGDTMMLNTACLESKAAPNADFLPMRVDFMEKFSSIGKTVGTYHKREGKPSEREVLVSRLIDRPLRPMFQEGFFNEVQVLSTVFSYDGSAPTDAMAICGSAAACHISSAPLLQAVAAVRLAHVDGEFIVNPNREQQEESNSDIVIAGTAKAILMIEGVCDYLTDEEMLVALSIAQENIAKICVALDELKAKAGREKILSSLRIVDEALLQKVRDLSEGVDEAVKVIGKKEREQAVNKVKERVFNALSPSQEELAVDPSAAERLVLLQMAWKKVISHRMRRLILDEDCRPDGRDSKTVRPIQIIPSFLPTAHGSVLFTRGETQTLSVATLGGEDMAMKSESIDGDSQARFYLQYTFPPFSVGEVGRVGAPGRREVGHGKLAERSLMGIIPDKETFPYVLRVESNILESNGSSSMASVCGGCLALMDAGVPIKRPVAGVAMGLILEEDKVAILTDILGMEDALGDMDFKVAGDADGITALQMDIKVEGITKETMGRALAQARKGRIHVLNVMKEAMPESRTTLPKTVPKVRVISIPTKRIGDLIGPGGKQIKALIEQCGGEEKININIAQEGTVTIMSVDVEIIEMAVGLINGITVNVEVGQRFSGKVTKTVPFGAYVEILPGKEAWCHISELEYKRTERVEDICKEGDVLEVQVTEVGRGGQFRVSRKPLLPTPPPREKESGPPRRVAAGDKPNSSKPDGERKPRPPARRKTDATDTRNSTKAVDATEN